MFVRLAKQITIVSALVSVSALLMSCGQPQIKATEAPSPAPVEEPKVAVPLSLEQRLLQKAEAAERRGHIFGPADDNAVLRYQSILMLDPDNMAAKAGVDGIIVQTLSEARDDLKSGKLSIAESKLRLLKENFGQNVLIDELDASIREYRAAQRKRAQANPPAERPVPKQSAPEDSEVIDAALLKRKDPALIYRLQRIAHEVQQNQKYVMIYASTDAEARWIYQTMRDAVPDYRIRGDIRIGKPKILFLPPLD